MLRELNCRWCGASFETNSSQRRHCSDQCFRQFQAWSHSKEGLANVKLARETPRPCPCCDTLFTGPANKLYCSKFCSDKQQRKGKRYDKQERMKNHFQKTATNLLEAHPCSICSRSTARRGYYTPRPLPIELPEDIYLCSRHHAGYARFVRKNSYEDKDLDIIFTTYLVHQTYSSRGQAGSDKDMAILRSVLKGGDCSVDYQFR